MPNLKLIVQSLFALLLLSIALLLSAGFGVSERAVTTPSSQDLGDLRTALGQFRRVRPNARVTPVTLTENQINTLAQSWNSLQGWPHITPRFRKNALEADALFPLPGPLHRVHYRISASFHVGQDAQVWPDLSIGALPLPRQISARILPWVEQKIWDRPRLSVPLGALRGLTRNGGAWTAKISNLNAVRAHLIGEARAWQNNGIARTQDISSIAPYLAHLRVTFNAPQAPYQLSNQEIWQSTFKLAQRRSTQSAAPVEARAALFAISLSLGPGRLRSLLAPRARIPGWHVVKAKDKTRRLRPPLAYRATLAGRGDLSRHMAVSAALQLHFGKTGTRQIGLLKELSDDNANGSGFDPTDILANILGQSFASLAAGPKQGALSLIDCLASPYAIALFTHKDLDAKKGTLWKDLSENAWRSENGYAQQAAILETRLKARIIACAKQARRY